MTICSCMIKRVITVLGLYTVFIFACKNDRVTVALQERDTTITIRNAYSRLFFDSTAMEAFIHKEYIQDSLADKLRNFYNGRNYQYAWFDEKGIAEFAGTFLHLQKQYIDYSRDSSLYDPTLQVLTDSLASDSNAVHVTPGMLLRTELSLTRQFFRYAQKAYQGKDTINKKDLEWFIPAKKVNSIALLDSLLINKGKDITQYEPVSRQYNLLKDYLIKYYEIQKSGQWSPVVAEKKSYCLEDVSESIVQIKRRLFVTGDLKVMDTSGVFDEPLRNAVKTYQHRYGLKEDGVIGASMLKEMNQPIERRIRQILINMERIRWMPEEPVTDYLLVNIPEYRLHMYEKGKYFGNMNVVVGSVAHNTVIFSNTVKHVVFSPYWNVPPGILKNEVLPGIKKNPRYLDTHNMEWNNGAVRQKPGINNSLGLVKFLFPNSYNIYLHDTPSKNLFSEPSRAFSHGCIRLGEPVRLAEFLLRYDSAWTKDRMNKAMHSGKEQYVVVKDRVPVFIGYFTAWVDRNGDLNFRDDIYGHDKKMEDKLF